jgi:hypothetical protein
MEQPRVHHHKRRSSVHINNLDDIESDCDKSFLKDGDQSCVSSNKHDTTISSEDTGEKQKKMCSNALNDNNVSLVTDKQKRGGSSINHIAAKRRSTLNKEKSHSVTVRRRSTLKEKTAMEVAKRKRASSNAASVYYPDDDEASDGELLTDIVKSIVIFLVNLLIVGTVNAWYLAYTLGNVSPMERLMLQLGMAMFKNLFVVVGVPLLSSSVLHTERNILLRLVMSIFNTLLIPLAVTAFTSSSCLEVSHWHLPSRY